MEKGTRQDLEMLINDLDNFYSYRGRNFFKLLEEDERIDFEDRIYHLYNDLQDRMDEIKVLAYLLFSHHFYQLHNLQFPGS